MDRPLIYQFTNLPIYQFTDLPIYRFTDLLIYRFTDLPIYQFTDLLTHCPPACQSTHLRLECCHAL